jgi:hypothetical protein
MRTKSLPQTWGRSTKTHEKSRTSFRVSSGIVFITSKHVSSNCREALLQQSQGDGFRMISRIVLFPGDYPN